jgi:hypothetical protein
MKHNISNAHNLIPWCPVQKQINWQRHNMCLLFSNTCHDNIMAFFVFKKISQAYGEMFYRKAVFCKVKSETQNIHLVCEDWKISIVKKCKARRHFAWA